MKRSTIEKIAKLLAELLGTALLVCLACMGTLFDASHIKICFGFGFAIMVVAQIFGHISGGHFNPAVTLSALLYGSIDATLAGLYTLAQCIGGFMGYGLLILVTPIEHMERSVCVTCPSTNVAWTQAFVVEFIITGILVLVCCAVWDPRNAQNTDSTPIRIGLTIAGMILVGGPYTGGSMNPARSLGPALWTQDWTNHWIYWFAPLTSAFSVTMIYKTVFWRHALSEEMPDVNNEEIVPLTGTEKVVNFVA